MALLAKALKELLHVFCSFTSLTFTLANMTFKEDSNYQAGVQAGCFSSESHLHESQLLISLVLPF